MPERLFQVLITDNETGVVTFTEKLERNIGSLRATYPNAVYRRYVDEELLDFIADNYPNEVLQAYQGMRPNAFKADLARYCLLHTYGGLYSDLSYFHVRSIEIGDADMVVFRDIPGHPSWATSNAVIYAKPNSPVLYRAIERVVSHFKHGYYGIHPLEPTGPYMLGRVLAETQNWMSITFGDSQWQDTGAGRRIVKVLPNEMVVAIRNKTIDGQISELISGGGDNYIQLWNDRRIWK